ESLASETMMSSREPFANKAACVGVSHAAGVYGRLPSSRILTRLSGFALGSRLEYEQENTLYHCAACSPDVRVAEAEFSRSRCCCSKLHPPALQPTMVEYLDSSYAHITRTA